MSRIALVAFLGLVLYHAMPTSAVFTEEEEEEVIRAHNFYRSKVQPTATDMLAMVSGLHWEKLLSGILHVFKAYSHW